MSGKFAGLKSVRATSASVQTPSISGVGEPSETQERPSRQGKKVVSGHFSPELSRALNVLAAEEGKTVQGLMGEAFDLLMRQYGKHPFGER